MVVISFEPFWQTLKQKGMSQYKLINEYDISPSILTRLKRDQGLSTYTIEKLCNILQCDIDDIMILKSEIK